MTLLRTTSVSDYTQQAAVAPQGGPVVKTQDVFQDIVSTLTLWGGVAVVGVIAIIVGAQVAQVAKEQLGPLFPRR